MKKISKAQQKVIDALKKGGCYIRQSPYYDFQQVVSETEISEPADKSGFVYKHYHILYFKKSTLDLLIKNDLIRCTGTMIYKLTSNPI